MFLIKIKAPLNCPLSSMVGSFLHQIAMVYMNYSYVGFTDRGQEGP